MPVALPGSHAAQWRALEAAGAHELIAALAVAIAREMPADPLAFALWRLDGSVDSPPALVEAYTSSREGVELARYHAEHAVSAQLAELVDGLLAARESGGGGGRTGGASSRAVDARALLAEVARARLEARGRMGTARAHWTPPRARALVTRLEHVTLSGVPIAKAGGSGAAIELARARPPDGGPEVELVAKVVRVASDAPIHIAEHADSLELEMCLHARVRPHGAIVPFRGAADSADSAAVRGALAARAAADAATARTSARDDGGGGGGAGPIDCASGLLAAFPILRASAAPAATPAAPAGGTAAGSAGAVMHAHGCSNTASTGGGTVRTLVLLLEPMGATLAQLLDERRASGTASGTVRGARQLRPRECLSFIADGARALLALHGADTPIIHHDFKPANLFVELQPGQTAGRRAGGEPAPHPHRPPPRVRLADFDVAEAAAGPISSFKGTHTHLPPEIWAFEQHGPPADVWAWGVTALEILTLAPPHETLDFAQLEAAVAQGALPVPEAALATPRIVRSPLLTALVALARRCLAVEPAARPAAAELVTELLRCELLPEGANASRGPGFGMLGRMSMRRDGVTG